MMGDKLIEYEEHQSLLEEGFDDGFQAGIEQKELDIIKEMLKKKYSYDEISQLTGKTIKEIKEIEKGLE